MPWMARAGSALSERVLFFFFWLVGWWSISEGERRLIYVFVCAYVYVSGQMMMFSKYGGVGGGRFREMCRERVTVLVLLDKPGRGYHMPP